MSPKIVDKEQRRESILGAAFLIFSQKGYHSTKLADIAQAAGIGQGTLYYYFPTKEEIFWGVYERMMGRLEEETRTRLASLESPKARMEALVRGIFESFPEIRPPWLNEAEEERWRVTTGFFQVMMEFWLQAERSGHQKEFFQRLSLHQNAVFSVIKLALTEARSPWSAELDLDVVAHLLIALRDGLGLQLRLGLIASDGKMFERIHQFLMSFVGKEYSS